MGRARDPLSVEYDEFSARFLELLTADPFGWHSARVTSPAGDPVDAGDLSAHERAMLRSLYYVLNSTAAEGPQGGRWVKNRQWSLQLGGWSEPELTGGVISRLFGTGSRRRVLYCRIVRGFSAYEAAAAMPSSRLYTANPDMQAQNQAL